MDAHTTTCENCRLLTCPGLRSPDPDVLEYLQGFKQGEITVDRGDQVFVQGAKSAHVYTVLDGVLIRYRLMEDGGRQIINFMFPGDFVGLQSAMEMPMSHGVEALTPARLCAFPRDRFPHFISNHSRLAFDLIWLASKEEAALEGHLVALGQHNARERIAYLAVFLLLRAQATGVAEGNRVMLAVTQSQIADMLGLSLVHTNRSLQTLRKEGIVHWRLNEIQVPDMEKALSYIDYPMPGMDLRPFL